MPTGALYFITICAKNRTARPLLKNNIANNLVETVSHLHQRGDWFARLFLVMPDHIHALISFPAENSMPRRVSSWKSYTARKFGIDWQERFFEHRLRAEDSLDEKAAYIRMNPVRARLVDAPEKWPFIFDAYTR
ncbi:MAG: transposase, partial [Opitutaceae bacterium]|nr:transposase [Opitutaceae bacterium]